VPTLVLSETLWRANEDLARACLEHPFVRSLGDGSLPPTRFASYIAQDAFFLRVFAKAYALALARSDDAENSATLRELLEGVLQEIEMHRGYAAELGIDLERVDPTPACRAYTDFLIRTAWNGSAAETMAALTPCLRLYAFIGAVLAREFEPPHPYQRWIETYGSPAFEALAARLEALLNRTATDTPTIRECYRYAMQCEWDFFTDSNEAVP
jgi:thiaminase/transcriptional activator TenA